MFSTILTLLLANAAAANFGHVAIIGDSITQAAGYSYTASTFPENQCRGYRWEVFKSLVDAGATFDLNGSTANNYTTDSAYPTWRGTAFYRANEGHFSWRAREILNGPDAARLGGNRGTGGIAQWLDTSKGGYAPDTVTLMIGINDLSDYINAGTTNTANVTISNYVAGIVGVLQSNNPNVRIYLCQLLQVGQGHSQYVPLNTLVDDYNASKLPGLAATMTTASSTVSVVNMVGPTNNGANVWIPQPDGFNPNSGEMLGTDFVHPNSRGERYIASRITAAMGLTNQWTSLTITNGNFEGGFVNAGASNCAPVGWTLYGTPSASVVPKQITDYQVVAESLVDLTATGTNITAGSSYILAGGADTDIQQTLAETLTAGRHYMLQASLYSGSSALTSGDWGVEIWAGGTKIAQADNQVLLKTYSTGTGYQIGSALTEVPLEFDAGDFPALLGQPLQIRLISRNIARYIGFEDLRLSWKPSAASAAKHYKIYVLTGQSNSLGTDSGTEINKLPGFDPADAQIPFWWHNCSGDIFNIPTATEGYSVGNCNGFWKTIRAQFAFNVYANITNAFGPEIGFARTMYYSGQTNIAIIKASRGGGGNSFWCKTNTDDHMYVLVTNTVINACNRMLADGNTFEIAGLLYLQGESDSTAESTAAGTRFKTLVDNLRADLPNAAAMNGYMVGNLTTAATRTAQEAIAAQYPAYLFYADSQDLTDEWVSDNLHQNKKAKLINGARFAQLVLGQAAHFDAAKNYNGIYGQPYGNATAGVAPFNGLTTVTTGHTPIFQGWSETPSTATMAAAAAAATNQSAASLNDSGTNAWNITDGDATGAAYFYTRKFTGTQTTNFANSGWVYSLNARFPTGYAENPSFFFQYGDTSSRWLAQVKRDLTGALTATFTNGVSAKTVVLQSAYDNGYHTLALRKSSGCTNAEFVFDGVTVGKVAAVAAVATLEPGVHFGTRDAAGKGAANLATVDFSAASVTASNTLIYFPNGSGSISGSTTQTVAYAGSGSAVTAVPNANYVFASWSDGATANPRTDTNVVFNLSVAANFVKNSFTLTYLTGANGSLTGVTTQMVIYGSSGSAVTAIPNTNYVFANWSDGVTNNPRADMNITSNLTVTANFQPGNVTLIYLAGANGTISGTATQTLAYAGSGTAVTATPNANYFFAGWSDGSTANSRTDANVISNLTVTANFSSTVAGGLYWDGGAANLTTNGDGISQGGSGTWNTTLTNWDQGNGLPHVAWNSTNTAVFGGAGGTVTLGSAIMAGGILNAASSDITLPGAYALTLTGALNLGTLHNLTIGNADAGAENFSAANLAGTTTLTLNKSVSTAYPSFNSANALNFIGTLKLRGGSVSTAPGTMGSLFLWLHGTNGTQAAGTAFALDTGAAANNGMDIVIGDWDANSGNRKLTFSSLSGFGTVRTDAGGAGTRNVTVNQSVSTIFNGMILSHNSTAGTVRSIAFTKDGAGSLTLAGIVGYETASSSGSASLSVTVLNGSLVLAATNTLTGATTVSGGALIVTGIHPATSPITVAAAGTLSGNGTINSAVTNNGILSPGFPLGSLTISNSPVLNGVALLAINRTNLPNSGKLIVSNALVFGGTLTVTNIATNNFAAGDTFVLFNAPSYSGHFTATNLPVLRLGLGWLWTPTNGTLVVIQTINPNPTNLICAVNGNQLQFSWPADHAGWTLEFQTNSLAAGLGTNWQPWSGSSNSNFLTLTNDWSPTSAFFRLRFP
jgi:autotransporter-associated beta strand protein